MADTAAAVVQFLQRRPRAARFVSEIRAALEGAGVAGADIEQSLADLEAAGRVLVREQYCADPHLEGTDLRLVGLVAQDGDDDPQARALAAMDATWQAWLADYLANHRCT